MLLSKIEGSPYWQLEQDFICPIDSSLIIPKFFVTDTASVPTWLRGIVDNDDPQILDGSLCHDWLYTKGSYHPKYRTRKECDQLLYDCCIFAGMPSLKASAVYWGVRMGGGNDFRK